MRDVLEKIDAWRLAEDEYAVSTVVKTWGSAPRPVGSKLVATRKGGVAGSVSAGCVEGAVIDESREVMKTGVPRLLTFGVADEDAWQVGLACGGTIQVFVEPGSAFEGVYEQIKRHLEEREPFAVVSVLEGMPERLNRKLVVLEDGSTEGDLEIPGQEENLVRLALEFLAGENGGTTELEDGTVLFVEVYPQPPKLIIVGAVHFAEPLVAIANTIGFDTIVVDPRRAFANRERFPDANQVLQQWPQEALPDIKLSSSTYIVVLTHDPKVDDPALQIALKSGARYIGALGSRRTNRKRIERLTKAGLSQEQIARLHAPIGLDIGGRSPGEIAVSIMAEIIKERNQSPAVGS